MEFTRVSVVKGRKGRSSLYTKNRRWCLQLPHPRPVKSTCCLALQPTAQNLQAFSDCTLVVSVPAPQRVSHTPTSPLSPFDGEGAPPATASHRLPSPVALHPAPSLSYSCTQMKLSIPARPQRRPPTPNPPYCQPPSALENPPIPARLYAQKTSPKKALQIHYALLLTYFRPLNACPCILQSCSQ